MTGGRLTTAYADGFGRWHVTAPGTGTVKAQRERARRAIAREVRARQGDQRPVIRLGSTPRSVDGMRKWTEQA